MAVAVRQQTMGGGAALPQEAKREPQAAAAQTRPAGPSRLAAFSDWIDTIALAFGAGLLASLALGLVALLLTMASAQAAERGERAERPTPALTFRSTDGTSVPAPLVHTDVDVRVTGFVARTRVSQRFRNPSDAWQEGVYVFPLPEGAAVDRLAYRIGERVIEGEIRERQAAARAYADAKREGRRAALVDGERPNVFTTAVANVGPQESVTVTLEYQETLAWDRGTFRLRFPMVVGPRYVPATGVADAARITPPVRDPKDAVAGAVHNPVNLRVDIDAGMALGGIYSPYHRIVVSQEGERYRIALAEGVVPADRDFELVWQPAAGATPQAAVLQEARGGEQYALVMVMPPAVIDRATTRRIPREAIFVIDTSGSMEGTSIVQAREALRLALDRLQPTDRFNVIEFNSHARALFTEARPASRANVDDARRWVEKLRATGGTEMAKALDLALDGSDRPDVVRQVVFLTDGAVGNEDELLRLIRSRLGASRLFTVGIGSAPNGFFMTKAAEEGRGTFTYIGKVDEVQSKMGELFARLESPLVKNIRIDWPGGVAAEAWPKRVPDLYAGEPLMVAVRLPASTTGALTVSGTSGDTPWQQTLKLVAPARLPSAATGSDAGPGAGLAQLWAGRKIRALLDEERHADDPSRVKDEIVKVALEHHLVSRYTALVAVDRTPVRRPHEPLHSNAVPTNLPDGWVHEAVFGTMPRTATPATLHALIGLALLILAAFAWRAGVAGGARTTAFRRFPEAA
jgi:Ca-activated chloride channel family protein